MLEFKTDLEELKTALSKFVGKEFFMEYQAIDEKTRDLENGVFPSHGEATLTNFEIKDEDLVVTTNKGLFTVGVTKDFTFKVSETGRRVQINTKWVTTLLICIDEDFQIA